MSNIDSNKVCSDMRRLYRATLLDDVLPFWLPRSRDDQHGGISNILDDAGQPIGYDKFIWSQGRALWTFSALCNRIERRADWLGMAHHVYRYLADHAPGADGRWNWRYDAAGNILDGPISLYADAFALNGLGEYYRATGDEAALQLALDTYQTTRELIAQPGSYELAPNGVPAGMKPHGVAMIFSYFYHELGLAAGRDDIRAAAVELCGEVLEQFYRPEHDAIVEFVAADGSYVDSPPGRLCVPGHALESMWFAVSILEHARDTNRIAQCCRIIRRHLELGWDDEHGGLIHAIDITGAAEPAWPQPDCKAWWVHVEAMAATLYAWMHTGEHWCIDWHEKVRQYAYAHFPLPTGEWRQWLDRRGARIGSAALPVKDPFHLPRALIVMLNLLDRPAQRAQ